MRSDHRVILEGHSSIMLCGSYYIFEALRRTQPNKAAVEGDYIVVANISGVKSKEGKELLRLRSSVDAGTYGDSLSADKFQRKIRRQFLNSEIQKLTELQVVGIEKKNLIIIRSSLKSLEINDLLLYVIFCLGLGDQGGSFQSHSYGIRIQICDKAQHLMLHRIPFLKKKKSPKEGSRQFWQVPFCISLYFSFTSLC